MTREEHLAWAKERALACLDGSPASWANAYSSFLSDLAKHPDNKGRYSSEWMGLGLVMAAGAQTENLRDWIEEFV